MRVLTRHRNDELNGRLVALVAAGGGTAVVLDEPVADELAAAAAAADKSAATPAEPVVPVLSLLMLMLLQLRLLQMSLRLSLLLRVLHSAAVSESACPSAVVGAEAVGYGAVPAVRTDLVVAASAGHDAAVAAGSAAESSARTASD